MADGATLNGLQCGRESRWVPARRCLRSKAPLMVWDWLLDASSLTRRLQQICEGRFQVRVLQQNWGRPFASERRALGIGQGERVLIREVRLMCNDRPWVFARTIIPVRSLRGGLRRLVYLGSKPLGAALFADPHMHRGKVEIARIGPDEQLFVRANEGVPYPEAIWGRRSIFWLYGKSLLVSEIFLPALMQFERDKGNNRGGSSGLQTASR